MRSGTSDQSSNEEKDAMRNGSRCSTGRDKASDEVCSRHNRGWLGYSVSLSQQLEYLHKTFGFLLDTERLMTGDVDLDDLQRKSTDFAAAFPYNVNSACLSCLVDEIQDCRILVSRCAEVDVTPLGILKFIVSFGGNDVFPNLKVGLQLLLTVSISVSGCERLRTSGQ